ncbi:uncharacterized protein B0I36DRAFT_312591 [Microdochium trichocladiopsis]|uniref:Protein disulfide-isomerase n=1 Tax=Microdochium trichocladiopsis TaxID=1682393 RepID=A0A9P8YGK3_9PEZI|nr:uncharacterized protein B0I36DRAFT_312591 [Microdochium trichocladiopsis]KAH7041327.1 hypothetical protein B0I36DRAFT_312591 [Microdochium trichocladiopsis]
MVRSTTGRFLSLPVALLFSSVAHAWDHLDHDTFSQTVQAHDVAVVACPGNSALKEEWDLVKTQTSVPLLSVGCLAQGEQQPVLCSSQSVDDPANLPVISMLERGQLKTVYPGPRRASAITQWINRAKHTTPTVELTSSSLTVFKTADEAACVAFLPKPEPTTSSDNEDDDGGDGTVLTTTQSAAAGLLQEHWAYIAESTTLGGRVSMAKLVDPTSQVLAAEGIPHVPAIKCWKNPEGTGGGSAEDAAAGVLKNNPYVKTNKWLSGGAGGAKGDSSKTLSGAAARDATVQQLEQFVVDATRPVIGELTAANHGEYLNRGKPIIYIFASTEAERAALRKQLSGSAITYADSLSIVTVDPFAFPRLQSQLGLHDNNGDDDTSPVKGVAEEHGREEGEVGREEKKKTGATVATPGNPVGVLVQLWSGNIWHYPPGAGFTVKELMGWGLKVKLGAVKPHREADVDWIWPPARRAEYLAEQERSKEAEGDRGRHDEL